MRKRTNSHTALVLFRLDLRLADNPALARAVASGHPVVPVFLWAPEEENPWPPGAASQWWLHQSLESLQKDLAGRGSRLVVRRGPSTEELLRLAAECGARSVFWNRRYEPVCSAREQEWERALRERGIEVEACAGNLLFEPGTIRNSTGEPFRVFTAFWRACQSGSDPPRPTPAPEEIPGPPDWPDSLAISDLGLQPEIDWAGGLREAWKPGESGAVEKLDALLGGVLEIYTTTRDCPGQAGTSRLSPHLHFGEISARQVWDRVRRASSGKAVGVAADAYLRQIAWREFSYHLLVHFPHTTQEPLRPDFRFFPWRVDQDALEAWTKGRTGYPMVDAGMRELWRTGWMHNRVRMLVASFLVKHLMIPWQEGAAWFWETLVDADLANNTMGWQWSAGCGADAAPYFRIFNPVLQGQKFDPEGDYVRHWVPELAQLPASWIHRPWEAPPLVLSGAGVKPGVTYPLPIVGHDVARKRALAALASMVSSPKRP